MRMRDLAQACNRKRMNSRFWRSLIVCECRSHAGITMSDVWFKSVAKIIGAQNRSATVNTRSSFFIFISRLSKLWHWKKYMYSWGKEVMWKSMWNFSEPPFFMKAFDKKWTRHRPYHLRCHVTCGPYALLSVRVTPQMLNSKHIYPQLIVNLFTVSQSHVQLFILSEFGAHLGSAVSNQWPTKFKSHFQITRCQQSALVTRLSPA